MSANPDKLAQDMIDGLADMFADDREVRNTVHRFSPSCRVGRRYLAVERGGFVYHIQLDVITPDQEDARD